MDASTPELEELCANWWDWHRRSRGDRAERKALEQGEPEAAWAAYWLVKEHTSNNTSGVVDLLVALNDAAPADDDGMTVGVGELEDLLTAHGDAVIEDVERCARQNPKFARAVSHPYVSGVSKPTEARLLRWRNGPAADK